MGTQLTPKQTIVALAVGMFALLAVFYISMIALGGEHDLMEWLLPGMLIVGVFLALPFGALLVNIMGQIVVLPFLAIFALVECIRKKK